MLAGRFGARLTTIEAPGGFGKSTLIGQVVEQAAVDGRSLELVVECRTTPGEPDAVLASIGRALGLDVSDAHPATPSRLADAMLARSPSDVVIWLDGSERLASADWLDELLNAMPATGHLVLVGRSVPPIATARLAAAGQHVALTADDMRFDVDEQGAFAALRGVSPETSADAEGWPALMELQAAAGRSGAVDFLTEEVLGSIDPRRTDALRLMSVVPRFDDSMLQAVTGFDAGVPALIGDLPLASVSEGVVQLHELMRSALRRGLTPESDRAAVSRSANNLLQRGYLLAAARLMAEIDDADGLGLIAERLIGDMHYDTPAADRSEVVSIVQRVLDTDVRAVVLTALTSAIADPRSSIELLDRAVSATETADRPDLEALAVLRLAEISYSSGDVEATTAHTRRLVDLAEAGVDTAQRTEFVARIYLLRMTGRTAEVPPLVDRLLGDTLGGELDREMRAVALFYRTVSLAYTGRVRESFAEVARHAPTLPDGLFRNRLTGVRAMTTWMLGELDAAGLEATVQLVDQIGESGQMQLFVEGAAATAIMYASAGDRVTAASLIRRADQSMSALGERAWSVHTVAQAHAVMDVLDGDEASAARRLDDAMPLKGPIDTLPSHVYFVSAVLSYVLVPRSRVAWEEAPVSPDLELRTEVGRALVAFRESDDSSLASALPWDDIQLLRPFALEPHLVELAVAAVSAGNPRAMEAFSALRLDPIVTLERLAGDSRREVSVTAKEVIGSTPRRPAHTMHLDVLGPLRIRRDGIDETNARPWRLSRARELLHHLIQARTISRSELAHRMWPDREPEVAAPNLRTALSRLLSAIEPGDRGRRPSWFVRVDGDTIRLVAGDRLIIDADRFEQLLDHGESIDAEHPREALSDYLAACEMYRGDLFDGLDLGADDDARDIVYFDALRWRGRFITAATRSADLLLSMGEADQAEALANRASRAEPLNESALRVLAASLLAQRRLGAATDVLRQLLEHLRAVQIPPEAETRALAERLGIAD